MPLKSFHHPSSKREGQPRRQQQRQQRILVLSFLCLLSLSSLTGASISSSGNTATIPRSTNTHHHRSSDDDDSDSSSSFSFPPWNPSKEIDDDGFLRTTYKRCPGEWEEEANIGGRHGPQSRHYHRLTEIPVRVRQVPGDGNCLFHSIATCLAYAVRGQHVCMKSGDTLRTLYQQSRALRQQAVDGLESSDSKLLFLQGHEYLRAKDLVEAAASQYGLSGERYCELMRQDSYWGGGPEIVALCNVLRRPIHVYELMTTTASQQHSSKPKEGNNKQCYFQLRRMACFGSPKFDRREPLHILSADSRFPDVTPGKQASSGNHFLAVFPDDNNNRRRRRKNTMNDHRRNNTKKASVRGGNNDIMCCKEVDDESLSNNERSKFVSWVSCWWTTISGLWTMKSSPKG